MTIQKLPDSGVGEELLSAKILRAGGWSLAALVHEIILDAIRLEYVPIVWRGGRLVVLYKGKGSPLSPYSYRGILVSDHLGKILTSLQQNLEETYVEGVGPCQFGAVKYRGTAMASLFLRAFIPRLLVLG